MTDTQRGGTAGARRAGPPAVGVRDRIGDPSARGVGDVSAWVRGDRMTGLVGVAVVLGLLGALGGTFLDWRLAVTVGLPSCLAVVLVASQGPGTTLPVAGTRDVPTWVVPAWVLLLFVSNLRLVSAGAGASSDVVNAQLGIDQAFELLVYVAVASLVVLGLLAGSRALRPTPVTIAVLAYPALAWVTTVWSDLALVTLVRGFQLAAVAAFGAFVLTEGFGRDQLRLGLERAMAWYVRVVFVLTLWAAVGPRWPVGGRLFWRGTHPLEVAVMIGIAVCAIWFARHRQSMTHPVPWPLVLVVLLGGLYLGRNRGPLAAILVALAVGTLVRSRRDVRESAVAGGLIAIVGSILSVWFTGGLIAYLLRGQSISTVVYDLNGRRELWEFILENPIGSWLWGAGFGANRLSSLSEFSYAGHAHNGFLDLLQTTGVIGVVLAATAGLAILVHAVRSGRVHAAWMMSLGLVVTLSNQGIATPGVVWTLMVMALVWLHVEPPAPSVVPSSVPSTRQTA